MDQRRREKMDLTISRIAVPKPAQEGALAIAYEHTGRASSSTL